MNPNVTTYANAFAKSPADAELPLAAVINEIKSGVHAAKVMALRAMLSAGDKTGYTKAKANLRAFTAAGTFSGPHRADCLLKHSGVLPVDLDHVDVSRLIAKFSSDTHVLYGFISPSGDGIKLGVIIGDNHLAGFFASQSYFHSAYGVKVDPACKDVSRLTFVSNDPGAWLNPSAKALEITAEAVAKAEAYKTTPAKLKASPAPANQLPLRAVAGEALNPATLAWVLYGTVANTLGGNHYKLHALARRCEGKKLTPAQRTTVFQAWHMASQTSGENGCSVLADSYDDYMGQFLHCFREGAIKHARTDVVLAEWNVIVGANGNYKFPPEADRFTDLKWKMAVALHHRLASLNPGRPFFLSTSNFERVAGLSHELANKIQNSLITMGILRVVEKHTAVKARRLAYQPINK